MCSKHFESNPQDETFLTQVVPISIVISCSRGPLQQEECDDGPDLLINFESSRVSSNFVAFNDSKLKIKQAENYY